ncbi:hypothetical protein BT96DRAFT_949716 [Gymnopus androsaceus JB14]|uniref:GH16 domain-containing protein n=1 Tax=Gymnopus androsaceus JB14 TaxID=1447944 RepID=A0A6A4GJZ4_9AGAR|nr:hypothetical protein BT96DRAFT_949716 [Gymnopus androsaceus JB14]
MDTGASIDITATDNCKVCGDSDLYLSTALSRRNITWAWASSSSNGSVSVTSSSSVSVSSSSADSSSPTSVSVAEAIASAPTTSSVSSTVAATSASTSVASLTSNTAFAHPSGASNDSGVVNLISINSDGYVIMWVDTTETASLENSMKLSSSETFNFGTMMIFDIIHMPTGCGIWPTLWLLGGGTWPAGGEVGIIEVVNEYIHNVMLLHHSKQCNALVDSTINVASNLDCYAYADQDQTCAATSTQTNSYGSGFNAQSGTCLIQIIDSGIYINYWAVGDVPSDITSGSPHPSSWSAQMFFSPTNYAIGTYFTDLALIINTNLSGTFTEGVWSTSGASGQQNSCASSTEYSTAASYIQNVGSDFSDAY